MDDELLARRGLQDDINVLMSRFVRRFEKELYVLLQSYDVRRYEYEDDIFPDIDIDEPMLDDADILPDELDSEY